jgi:hypothetical protein
MFQTLQPDTIRMNKTALPGRRLQLKINLDERPRTVGFGFNNHINSSN